MSTSLEDTAHFVIISADCHAGAPVQGYKPYLESKWHAEFDEWAAAFDDPWTEIDKGDVESYGVASADSSLNWDSAKRLALLEADGIVGEVLFPNTAPPFFPSGVLSVAVPTTQAEYDRRAAGLRAHNRWLVDFCAEAPGRRAGVAQVFLNDVEDTVAEIQWAKDAGLTGGILLPGDAPGRLVQLYYPRYDAIWQLCEDLEMPVHQHSTIPGDAVTEENGPAGAAIGVIELMFFAHRRLAHMIFAGVFDRFPALKFVTTESGADWVPERLGELDFLYDASMSRGSIAEYFVAPSSKLLKRRPSEYFKTNCFVAATLSQAEVALRDDLGVDTIMWGSDLPHFEGCHPYTREALRAAFAGTPLDDVRRMVTDTAAKLYGFDVSALQRVADEIGAPTVAEVNEPLLAMPPSISPAFIGGDKRLDRAVAGEVPV